LAGDAPTGTWTLVASDVLSGQVATQRFRVGAP